MDAEGNAERRLPTVSRGRGPRFIRHRGKVATLVLNDRDGTQTTGAADPAELVPDDDRQRASILIARANVGTGADPLSAIASLLEAGVRAILAPGFSPDLYVGLVASGVLPVTLEDGAIEAIADQVASGIEIELTIDLETELVEGPGVEAVPFSTDPRVRNKLLLGLTDLDEALRHTEEAAGLRTRDREQRPWMYEGR